MEQNLTVSDYDTLIEALDAWTTASKHTSMLAGLMMGALIAGANDVEAGSQFVERMNAGEDQKAENRKEIAIILKAKLIRERDALVARQFADSIK